ncbi:immediate early response 3-interacting protein 1-like [Diorhabda carinulata]|uniref:immediate early response 3-interacting protein 1 n=1 Tax=Diorhabda sublineata TaxID=1163346 RepID=UPI0024E0FBB8|nr:immediate early response 3-interacting protein 1 [Diorhabda sublineata]XP_057664518.1 immediate early response 3-interacting protein 1-like [Diorhabda carinulata]
MAVVLSLWNLLEASLLFLNAVCILNEDRFLSKIGWSFSGNNIQGFGENPSTKSQIYTLFHSIRTVARIPLIFLNILMICLKLILG